MISSSICSRRPRRRSHVLKSIRKRDADRKRPHGGEAAEAFTYDISIGGARLHAMEAYDVGSLLRLDIELNKNAVKGKGQMSTYLLLGRKC